MPEGPEVETIRRSLEPLLVGATLGRPRVSSKKLRTATTTAKLRPIEGRRVRALGRHGKLMWLELEGELSLLVRLGMSGRLVVEDEHQTPAPHTHVRVPLVGVGQELRYVDPRRFGEVVLKTGRERDEEIGRMGPDGLSSSLAGAVGSILSTERSLKDVLLDQSVIAGVGNIYAAEALFQARLSPFQRGKHLDPQQVARLLEAVPAVLRAAVERRGTTFSNYVDGRGERGDNFAHLFVFQREGEPCRVCTSPIVREVQGQRSTFYCPRCQPAPGTSRSPHRRARLG